MNRKTEPHKKCFHSKENIKNQIHILKMKKEKDEQVRQKVLKVKNCKEIYDTTKYISWYQG